MLLSAIHAEGPIWKGHTSFNIAARTSYFNWIMQPLLDKVYDNPNALKPYSKMNYYDLNAKFVHKFSDRDKLTAVVYWGKDVSDASPSDSYKIYKGDDNDKSDYLLIKHSTINHWDNVMGSAYWTHLFNNSFSLNVNANISHYLYYLKLSSLERTEKEIKEDSYASFNSEINEASLSTDFRLKRESKHDIRWGIKGAYQWMLPQVDTYSYILPKGKNTKPIISNANVGDWQHMTTMAIYGEDDWTASSWLKANLGLRYSLYAVTGKTYHSIEPRASLRFLITPKIAFKL